MNSSQPKTDPALSGCLMIVFGATGDLTQRLLLPSIYNLAAAKLLPESFRLLGVAKETWDDSKFKDHIATTLNNFGGGMPQTKPSIG